MGYDPKKVIGEEWQLRNFIEDMVAPIDTLMDKEIILESLRDDLKELVYQNKIILDFIFARIDFTPLDSEYRKTLRAAREWYWTEVEAKRMKSSCEVWSE